MTGHQIMTATGTAQLPALFTPTPQAAKRTLEFFTAQISHSPASIIQVRRVSALPL